MEPRRSVYARVLLVMAAVAGLLFGTAGPVRAAEHRAVAETGPSRVASAGHAVQRERRVEAGHRALQVADGVATAGPTLSFAQHLWQADAAALRLPGRADDLAPTAAGSVGTVRPPVPDGRAPPQSAGT